MKPILKLLFAICFVAATFVTFRALNVLNDVYTGLAGIFVCLLTVFLYLITNTINK